VDIGGENESWIYLVRGGSHSFVVHVELIDHLDIEMVVVWEIPISVDDDDDVEYDDGSVVLAGLEGMGEAWVSPGG